MEQLAFVSKCSLRMDAWESGNRMARSRVAVVGDLPADTQRVRKRLAAQRPQQRGFAAARRPQQQRETAL